MIRRNRHLPIALLLAAIIGTLAVLFAGAPAGDAKQPPRAPKTFFGIAPQSGITPEDLKWMRAGNIGTVRVAIPWEGVQPTRKGGYVWSGFDQIVETITRGRLQVLPFLYGTPKWLARDWRTLPVDNAKQRQAWSAFLKAVVGRYGPGGDFWDERAPTAVNYQSEAIRSPQPIRNWQIWNEANFFYFAYPVSPGRYARLAMASGAAIKSVDPKANVILSGLFGEPTAKGRKGMDATDFLRQLYRKPGIKSRFDSVALHPYAVDAESLEEMIEGIHEVTEENHDRPGLHLTELGWGSENNFRQVAFEQGPRGQAEQLRDSYTYMLENRGRLNLKSAYWFSWKDLKDSCSFCDSVGFFPEGLRYKPKPAWRAFVRISRGKVRP
jgi:hypothetical protein